jgi:antitoxin MazE
MHSHVAKWGNSLALRLPKNIADGVRLKEGTQVELELQGDVLLVRPARPKYKLADLLSKKPKQRKHEEFDWGQAKGEEAW